MRRGSIPGCASRRLTEGNSRNASRAIPSEAGTRSGERSKGKGQRAKTVRCWKGEGRCPVAPLVFKTSLGTVRASEGSTPSLLRQSQVTSHKSQGTRHKAQGTRHKAAWILGFVARAFARIGRAQR